MSDCHAPSGKRPVRPRWHWTWGSGSGIVLTRSRVAGHASQGLAATLAAHGLEAAIGELLLESAHHCEGASHAPSGKRPVRPGWQWTRSSSSVQAPTGSCQCFCSRSCRPWPRCYPGNPWSGCCSRRTAAHRRIYAKERRPHSLWNAAFSASVATDTGFEFGADAETRKRQVSVAGHASHGLVATLETLVWKLRPPLRKSNCHAPAGKLPVRPQWRWTPGSSLELVSIKKSPCTCCRSCGPKFAATLPTIAK